MEAWPDGRDAGTESTNVRSRLALVAVAVVTVLCVVGAAIAAVAAGGQAFAYKANGTQVSQSTVDDELEWLAGSKTIATNLEKQGTVLSPSDGSIASSVTASWLNQRIQTQLLLDAAARQDVGVPKSTSDQLRSQYEKQYPNAPSSAIDVLVDGTALVQAMGLTTQAKQQAFFTKALRGADIYVNPRYGSWRGRHGVCPPSGCPVGS